MKINDTLYNWFLYPFEQLRLSAHRHHLLKHVKGKVLEIGAGTGLNLKHYDFNQIQSFTLSDLTLSKSLVDYTFPTYVNASRLEVNVEHLPFEDNQFDYVVFTLVFCSVPNPKNGFKEIARVLKPNGKVIFIEHILPKNPYLIRLFRKLTPTWRRIASGCHLDRETLQIMESCGFKIQKHKHFFRHAFVSGYATLK